MKIHVNNLFLFIVYILYCCIILFSRGLGPQWNEKDPWPTFDPKIERKWPFLDQNREERKPQFSGTISDNSASRQPS